MTVKMNTFERSVFRAIEQRSVVQKRIDDRVKAARQALWGQRSCAHPVTEDYEWEHDNGYGNQHKITGERCVLCLLERAWKGSGDWLAGDVFDIWYAHDF